MSYFAEPHEVADELKDGGEAYPLLKQGSGDFTMKTHGISPWKPWEFTQKFVIRNVINDLGKFHDDRALGIIGS